MAVGPRRDPVQGRGIAGQKRLARRKKIGVGRLGAQSDGEDAGGDERQTAQSPFPE